MELTPGRLRDLPLSIGHLPQILIRHKYLPLLLQIPTNGAVVSRIHSARMPRVSYPRSRRYLLQFLSFHNHPPGEAATLFWVCLHVLMIYSRDTANTMGPLYGPPTPGRMHSQETRPDSRPNHNADSEMHEMYREFVHNLTSSPDVLTFFLSLRLQALLKDPRNHPPTALVDIRREKRVVLVLALHSNSQPISNLGWEGILLPQTRSVDPVQQISPRRLLKLSIQVHACSTGAVNVRPCDNCWSRERPPTAHNVQPYMIDFQAQSRRIALSTQMDGNENCLKADVKFHFTCYSRHHGGMYR